MNLHSSPQLIAFNGSILLACLVIFGLGVGLMLGFHRPQLKEERVLAAILAPLWIWFSLATALCVVAVRPEVNFQTVDRNLGLIYGAAVLLSAVSILFAQARLSKRLSFPARVS